MVTNNGGEMADESKGDDVTGAELALGSWQLLMKAPRQHPVLIVMFACIVITLCVCVLVLVLR
jgi:hypothetical protein